MLQYTTEKKILFTLRLAVAMCFIGHGAFGIITKAVWCNYFAVFGIGEVMAYKLMPVLGIFDIVLGLTMLIYPIRLIALWLVIWGLITAALRPLSGEPFAELIERAGNFGAPLALLILCDRGVKISSLINKITATKKDHPGRLKIATLCLRCTACFLLMGHGWLNLADKKGLISQYTSLGFHNPFNVALVAGVIEMAMGIVILVKPVRPLILIIFVWKISTELFYPHWEIFEWIERGGSYGVLLALWFAMEPVRENLGYRVAIV